MQKRFGIGFSAGGPLSILGIEADVNLTEDFSLSGGLGTGLTYNTGMVKGRYFINGDWVSPYLGLAVARWWTEGTRETKVAPAVLNSKFLEPGTNLRDGFNVWLVAPSIGVQFMHAMGLSVFAEVHYLFRLFSMSNGTYAGLGLHWYM